MLPTEGGNPSSLVGMDQHAATGNVFLAALPDGVMAITLAGFRTEPSPHASVYLCQDRNHETGIELGRLTEFSGQVQFLVPAGVDPGDFNSIVVWCKTNETGLACADL